MGDHSRRGFGTDELLSHSVHEFFTRGPELIGDESSVSEDDEEPEDNSLCQNNFPVEDFDHSPSALNIEIGASNFDDHDLSVSDWYYPRFSTYSATVGSDMQAAWTIAEQSPGDLGDFRHTIALDGYSNSSHLEKLNDQLPNDDGPLQHDFLSSGDDTKERRGRCSTATHSSSTRCPPVSRARSSTSYTCSSRDRAPSWGEESCNSNGAKAIKVVSPINTRQRGGTISVGTAPGIQRYQPLFKTTLGQQSSEPIQDINRYISTRRKVSNTSPQKCYSSHVSESSERSSTPSTVSTAFQMLGVTGQQSDDRSTPSQSPGPVTSPIDSSFRAKTSSGRGRQPRIPYKTRAYRPRPVKRPTSESAMASKGNTPALKTSYSISDPAAMAAAVAASYIQKEQSSL